MKNSDFESIIALIEKALNENAGVRINEYTGTGILHILARDIGKLVDNPQGADDDNLRSGDNLSG